MKTIEFENLEYELQEILNNFSDNIFPRAIKNIDKFTPDERHFHDIETGTSEKYLRERLAEEPKLKHGAPMSVYGYELNFRNGDNYCYDLIQETTNHILKLGKYLGAEVEALSEWYPPNGYIGWHNNCDVPGWNILFTYNKTGNGFFKYYNRKEDKIYTIQDKSGWNIKFGYYGGLDEGKEKWYWHCAGAYDHRFTIAYVLGENKRINDMQLWDTLVDDFGLDPKEAKEYIMLTR